MITIQHNNFPYKKKIINIKDIDNNQYILSYTRTKYPSLSRANKTIPIKFLINSINYKEKVKYSREEIFTLILNNPIYYQTEYFLTSSIIYNMVKLLETNNPT